MLPLSKITFFLIGQNPYLTFRVYPQNIEDFKISSHFLFIKQQFGKHSGYFHGVEMCIILSFLSPRYNSKTSRVSEIEKNSQKNFMTWRALIV
jgi:hypothetical protein